MTGRGEFEGMCELCGAKTNDRLCYAHAWAAGEPKTRRTYAEGFNAALEIVASGGNGSLQSRPAGLPSSTVASRSRKSPAGRPSSGVASLVASNHRDERS